MSQERLMWQGQLREKTLEARRLKISVEGLRDGIRLALNPHVDIGEIDEEAVGNKVIEFAEKLADYKELCDDMAKLKRDLGIR